MNRGPIRSHCLQLVGGTCCTFEKSRHKWGINSSGTGNENLLIGSMVTGAVSVVPYVYGGSHKLVFHSEDVRSILEKILALKQIIINLDFVFISLEYFQCACA